MFSSFEIFSSSKNEFKGTVNYDGFRVRRRRKFFDTGMSAVVAQGTYRQKDNLLVIETEINGFNGMFIPIYIMGLIIYPIFFISFFLAEDSIPLWVIPFLLVHAAFMFGIPYFVMRRSTQRMKYELEREFTYVAKK